MSILKHIIEIFTGITCLGFAALSIWSIWTQEAFIVSAVAILLTLATGFFSYLDIRNILAGKQ